MVVGGIILRNICAIRCRRGRERAQTFVSGKRTKEEDILITKKKKLSLRGQVMGKADNCCNNSTTVWQPRYERISQQRKNIDWSVKVQKHGQGINFAGWSPPGFPLGGSVLPHHPIAGAKNVRKDVKDLHLIIICALPISF